MTCWLRGSLQAVYASFRSRGFERGTSRSGISPGKIGRSSRPAPGSCAGQSDHPKPYVIEFKIDHDQLLFFFTVSIPLQPLLETYSKDPVQSAYYN